MGIVFLFIGFTAFLALLKFTTWILEKVAAKGSSDAK